MSWRIEKTKSGQDLVWSNPELGISPSALKGTANIQNFNIATEPGQAYVSYARTNQAQASITGGTLTPDGATLLDGPVNLYSGAWITVTASTVSSISATAATTLAIDYLVVGGGGAGGGLNDATAAAGGGGAGRVLESSGSVSVGTYAVTVGAGGSGGVGIGATGSSSIIASVATAEGGAGGGDGTGANGANAVGGGSGGGGGANTATAAGTGGTGATGGNNGGNGAQDVTNSFGGGGGGVSAVGANGSTASEVAGAGGDGTSSSITGTATNYGGGGGGGSSKSDDSYGLGGSGGGGRGGRSGSAPVAGTANTGGGGGGAGAGTPVSGASGGSGIVVISYATGSAYAKGGTITQVGANTVHTFTADGVFELLWINPGNIYYVSYKDGDNKIKLSTNYDPYGTDVLTHGTTGSVTFNVLAVPGRPLAKATEKYNTSTGTEYRYYLLDANSRIWVYDTQVYDSTLAANTIGVTWMLADPATYTGYTGIGVLNGWLFALDTYQIVAKPTVTLGSQFATIYQGYLMNPFPTHRNFALTTSQGTLIYTDGNFIGEIFPTTSLETSEANIQTYAEYTASGSTGTLTSLIGGSLPKTAGGTRVPAVFFTETGGTLPTAVSADTVYYIAYDDALETFTVFTAITAGSSVDISTGASGTQYFNTFWPRGSDAGADGTNPLVQFTPQRVNLPFYEITQCLIEIGNTVLIGCRGSKVYPWNQVDATPSDVITLPESDVQTMINANNTAYIFAGNKGNIYVTNNVVASLALKVPDYCAGVPGSPLTYIEPYFTWGDSMFVRGRIYFSILDQTATKAGNCGGVWSFVPSQNIDPSQDVGIALRLENQNSYGDYDGYAPILIPAEEQTATAPQYWAAWQDSYNNATASFGIDFTASTPVTTAVFETDLMPSGTLLDKTTFSQLEYKVSVPLNSGDSVQLYWRTTSTSAWTSAGTVRDETTNDLSGYFPANFQKTQWLQIRGVITTGGTTASSFVPIVEVRLR